MQQHISKSCAPRWALIDYCKAMESLPVHTNPQGVLNSQGYWHTRGVVTLAHAMWALLAVLKLDWTRSTWIMLCMALTWKADGTSAGLARALHQATLWCCLQPTCLAQDAHRGRNTMPGAHIRLCPPLLPPSDQNRAKRKGKPCCSLRICGMCPCKWAAKTWSSFYSFF